MPFSLASLQETTISFAATSTVLRSKRIRCQLPFEYNDRFFTSKALAMPFAFSQKYAYSKIPIFHKRLRRRILLFYKNLQCFCNEYGFLAKIITPAFSQKWTNFKYPDLYLTSKTKPFTFSENRPIRNKEFLLKPKTPPVFAKLGSFGYQERLCPLLCSTK